MEHERKIYPLLPLRGLTVFPYMSLHFDVGREKSLAALSAAMTGDQLIFLATQKDIKTNEPEGDDIYSVGTLSKIKQVLALPGDNIRLLVEGMNRARIVSHLKQDPYLEVEIEIIPEPKETGEIETEAMMRVLQEMIGEYARISGKISADTIISIGSIDSAGRFADVIAADVLHKVEDKQTILETFNVMERMEKLTGIIRRETDIQRVEKSINQRVRRQLDKSQREYYLREQMKAIQNELGDKDAAAEADELRERANRLPLSEEAREKVLREIDRLARMQTGTPDASVTRTYIDWILDMPWGKFTTDNLSLKNARTILDEDHYGLDKVKERIIEYLAVRSLKNDMKGPILCFVGPPGVGKTSIARSIARSLGRSFCRMSLGGVRDEAEIRGHRRTYVGAIPGSIVTNIRQAGTGNPVFLFDEIDKMGTDYRGDPASAMLEVLDPEQNKAFRDHYLEIAFDLSQVLFITTANTTDTIPRPLLDRMEVIEVSSYTEQEKLGIARRHLLPKQAVEHGLGGGAIEIEDDALIQIINHYTSESGVRGLERQISKVCRKVAREIVEGAAKPVTIKAEDIEKYLGKKVYRHERTEGKPKVGVATGLAWTAVGGTTLNIEVSVMDGTGKLELTGQLGDVMKESAHAGLSYIRSRTDKLGIDKEFYTKKDIHIHIPEGATPKDGPSAGITMATAAVSALLGKCVRGDTAMTGEITLRGRVLPVGGIKEKILAAHRAGINRVLLPTDNYKDLDEIPDNVKKVMEFITVNNMDEVLANSIIDCEPGNDKES